MKKKKAKTKTSNIAVYVATWESESSERGVEGYWLTNPSEQELTAHFKEEMPWEFEGGRRTVWWEVVELNERNLPDGIPVVESI